MHRFFPVFNRFQSITVTFLFNLHSWPVKSPTCWLWNPFHVTPVTLNDFLVFSTPRDAPDSSWTCSAPDLESVTPPSSSGLFYWEMACRHHSLTLEVVSVTNCSCYCSLARPIDRKRKCILHLEEKNMSLLKDFQIILMILWC